MHDYDVGVGIAQLVIVGPLELEIHCLILRIFTSVLTSLYSLCSFSFSFKYLYF